MRISLVLWWMIKVISADFDASIRQAIADVDAFGLLEAGANRSALRRSEEFNKLALSSKAYVEIYEKGLTLSHYNILLKDLAFFQFSYKTPEEWALAFYPNPRLTGSVDALAMYQELCEERDRGEWDDEDFASLAQDMPAHIYVPRIRFEYSRRQYEPIKHPGAHFHIGMSGEDRWASSRKISPRTFSLLIIRYYYPAVWWPLSRFTQPKEEWGVKEEIEKCIDNKLMKSFQNDGVSLLFEPDEHMLFHFTALQGRTQP